MTEKKEGRKLTCDQKDGLGCVSWALKDTVLSKLEKDTMFRYKVQSCAFIERHWNILSKDWKERNLFVPEVLHDGYGSVRRMIECVLSYFGIALPNETMEKILQELFWLFLVGGHVYLNDFSMSEA